MSLPSSPELCYPPHLISRFFSLKASSTVRASYCARAFLFRQACRLIEWEGVARMTLRFDAMSTMYCGVRLLGCMSFHAGPGHFQFMDNLQHVAMRNQSPNLRSSQMRKDPCSPSEETRSCTFKSHTAFSTTRFVLKPNLMLIRSPSGQSFGSIETDLSSTASSSVAISHALRTAGSPRSKQPSYEPLPLKSG